MESNFVVIETYIWWSQLPTSKRFLETRHISQTDALAELIRAFRFAGYKAFLTGDFTAYTVDHYGFAGKESAFDSS